jgi:hypothetical protein
MFDLDCCIVLNGSAVQPHRLLLPLATATATSTSTATGDGDSDRRRQGHMSQAVQIANAKEEGIEEEDKDHGSRPRIRHLGEGRGWE